MRSSPLRPIAGIGRSVLAVATRDWGAGQLAFLLNLPAVVLTALVVVYPLVYALNVSVNKFGLAELRTGGGPFVGVANYLTVLSDPIFWDAFQHTLIFSAASIVLMLAGGLAIALLMDPRDVWIAGVTRAVVLVPFAVPPVINGLMWRFIYDPNLGSLNAFVHTIGLTAENVNVAGSTTLALPGVVVAYVWRTLPFSVLLFHAALRSIPRELFEAARVDGAGAFRTFWSITLPLLRPTIVVILVLRTAFAFAAFDEIFAVTSGGPGNSTWVAAWYTYSYAFRYSDLGVGAASAFLLTAVVLVLGMLYIRLLYRRTEY
jgi:multiple sugar transport system permease protein